MTTSGRSRNILEAVRAARARGLSVIGMTGEAGSAFARRCDAALVVPSRETARIQEVHLLVGHILCERAEDAAVREVREETGLADLSLRGMIETIDWYFRFRGRLIHKVCHFFLMETTQSETAPQRAEGSANASELATGAAPTNRAARCRRSLARFRGGRRPCESAVARATESG